MPRKATASRRSARTSSTAQSPAPTALKPNVDLLSIAACLEKHAVEIQQQAAALRMIASPEDLPMIFERVDDSIIPRSIDNPDGTPRAADGERWLNVSDATRIAGKSIIEMRALWLSVCQHFDHRGTP